MSVKCILQGQNDKSPKLYFNKILPDKPAAPIAADEEIPYSWDELNAIALSGKAADYVSVGAIKSVTLTSAVLGTTTHDIRVIGINQDNDQSITFQTKNCLVDTTSFGSSAQWIGSTARTECQNYYNAFPGKAAIKTVKKGTCLSTNDFRNGDVTYNDETVWLLSEREMNLNENSPLSVANSSNTKAECTQGKNFAYNYYSNNNSRIKTLGDNGNVKQYWERSRHYESDHMKYVCNINTDGDANPDFIGTYSTYFGLAPAFVIGNEEALSKGTLIQDGEDVTEKVKEIVKPTIEEIGAAAATHAAQHAAGGSDPITPESIGAASLAAMAKKPDAVQERLTVYVAKTGSDATGDGSEAKPFLTIQKALDSLPRLLLTPTTVCVQAGTYDERVNIVQFTGSLLRVTGADGATVSTRAFYVSHCNCSVVLSNFTLTGYVEGSFHLGIWSDTVDYLQVEKMTCTFENLTASPYGAIRFEYCLEGMLSDSTVSNQAVAVDVLASDVYLRQLAGTGNTVAIRCGSGEGAVGGFVQKGYQVTITGEEQKGYGGQIW